MKDEILEMMDQRIKDAEYRGFLAGRIYEIDQQAEDATEEDVEGVLS